MKNLKGMVVLGVIGALTACSHLPQKYQFIHDNSYDYKTAYVTPPLSVPSGYSSDQFDQYYVVPNPQLAGNGQQIDLVPPDLSTEKIKAAKLPKSNKPWYLVDWIREHSDSD